GPGGLKAALTAAQRGHEVVLCEKNDEVGGILIGEQAIPFKHEMYQLGVSLGRLVEAEGVDIRLNTAVDKAYAENEKADVVIVAAGSTPLVPPIEGIDGDNVVVINEYHHKVDQIKDTVVVLGGGLAGCEAAIHFAREGKSVKLVEMRGELSPDANIRHRPLLLQEIEKSGIEVYLNHKGLKISNEGVLCEELSGEKVMLEGQSVLCALGQRANRAVVDELLDVAPIVKTIGDCVKVSTITTAMYQGHHAALNI
ncbi:MAG: FAD-dependent oxidoreductase, partial [Clostridia bacterium]|nr:FAD-dependent oxidoreductase [Clostridia bacterium]